MSTYNGWTIVTMPSTPSARNVEFAQQNVVGSVVSPFTGQEQIQDWNASWMEASLTMPQMLLATGQPWIDFLVACRGRACVFQLPSFLAAFVPSGAVPGTYWRLKENTAKWSINLAFIVGMEFDIREAI
jgi:hypothetical protein